MQVGVVYFSGMEILVSELSLMALWSGSMMPPYNSSSSSDCKDIKLLYYF